LDLYKKFFGIALREIHRKAKARHLFKCMFGRKFCRRKLQFKSTVLKSPCGLTETFLPFCGF